MVSFLFMHDLSVIVSAFIRLITIVKYIDIFNLVTTK